MAGLKFFVSSTCYDLSEERNQIRTLIKSLGHEPILSDHAEILYDYDEHTHLSCVREISNVDIVVLIIGSRFGGVAIDETKKLINLSEIQDKIHKKSITEIFEKIDAEKKEEKRKEESSHGSTEPYKAKSIGFSITHFEILKAIEQNIPVFVFIKDKISNFYEFYIQNKYENPKLTFPDFSLEETKYLAEFISILKRRKINNSIHEYSNYLDIETQLKQQLALKFRNLLINERNEKKEAHTNRTQMEVLSQQFSELSTALISILPKGQEKEAAKGVLKFRRSLSLLFNLQMRIGNLSKDEIFIQLKTSSLPFDEYLKQSTDYKKIIDTSVDSEYGDIQSLLVRNSGHFIDKYREMLIYIRDSDFFYFRDRRSYIMNSQSWDEYIGLEKTIRSLIVDALCDTGSFGNLITGDLRFVRQDFAEFLESARFEVSTESYQIMDSVER